MKFAANLTTMLEDIPKMIDRYLHICSRKDYSFEAVECQNPYTAPLSEWQETIRKVATADLKTLDFVLINSPPVFSVCNGIPTREEFQEKVLEKTVEYAVGLKVSKVHLVMTDCEKEQDRSSIVELLMFGANSLSNLGITTVIEPLSIRPNYYLRSYDVAKELAESHPSIQVMLDTFHLQKLHGNLTEYFQRVSPVTGHVQVSQVPLRDTPANPGELDYNYVLPKIAEFYKDYVGLEYNGNSSQPLDWLHKFDSA